MPYLLRIRPFALLIIFGVVFAPSALCDEKPGEKPDAPLPKIAVNDVAQDGARNPPAFVHPVRDGSTAERWIGVKHGLKSFDTSWDAPPFTPRQKYVFALYEAEDL